MLLIEIINLEPKREVEAQFFELCQDLLFVYLPKFIIIAA